MWCIAVHPQTILEHIQNNPHKFPEIMLCMLPANERRRYNVTSSLSGRAHTQHNPWWFVVIQVRSHNNESGYDCSHVNIFTYHTVQLTSVECPDSMKTWSSKGLWHGHSSTGTQTPLWFHSWRSGQAQPWPVISHCCGGPAISLQCPQRLVVSL